MPNAIHFPFEVYEMNGLLYLAIGSPNSSILEILGQAFDEGNPDSAYFLLPKELGSTDYPFSYWSWNGNTFEFQISDDRMPKEWFLLFSNNIDLADQIEGVVGLLEKEKNLSIGRILLFINSQVLFERGDLLEWMNGCAHFADAICYTNRNNENGKKVAECVDKYKSFHYPLENFILKKNKPVPLSQILSTTTRRISHIFDPPDLLEENESVQSDPFLERNSMGKRNRPIPLPFSNH